MNNLLLYSLCFYFVCNGLYRLYKVIVILKSFSPPENDLHNVDDDYINKVGVN